MLVSQMPCVMVNTSICKRALVTKLDERSGRISAPYVVALALPKTEAFHCVINPRYWTERKSEGGLNMAWRYGS